MIMEVENGCISNMIVSFHLGSFSASMIMGGRVIFLQHFQELARFRELGSRIGEARYLADDFFGQLRRFC